MPPAHVLYGRGLPPPNARQVPSTNSRGGQSNAQNAPSRASRPQPSNPAAAPKPATQAPQVAKRSKQSTSETFEERERKERICRVLDSWEKLATISLGVGESIPQTRLRYQKLLTKAPSPPRATPASKAGQDEPDVMEIDPPPPPTNKFPARRSPRSTRNRRSPALGTSKSQPSARRPLLTNPSGEAEWPSENEEDYEETLKIAKAMEEQNRERRRKERRKRERKGESAGR